MWKFFKILASFMWFAKISEGSLTSTGDDTPLYTTLLPCAFVELSFSVCIDACRFCKVAAVVRTREVAFAEHFAVVVADGVFKLHAHPETFGELDFADVADNACRSWTNA